MQSKLIERTILDGHNAFNRLVEAATRAPLTEDARSSVVGAGSTMLYVTHLLADALEAQNKKEGDDPEPEDKEYAVFVNLKTYINADTAARAESEALQRLEEALSGFGVDVDIIITRSVASP